MPLRESRARARAISSLGVVALADAIACARVWTIARRFTSTCLDGFTQRHVDDMHECSDGDCDESDCCQNGCDAVECPAGQQRIDSYDQSGCSSLPDGDGDGVGDGCTTETCCFTPCYAWTGTCDTGEKSQAGHIGCCTC